MRLGASVENRWGNARVAKVGLTCGTGPAAPRGVCGVAGALQNASRPGGVVALAEGTTLALWCAHTEKKITVLRSTANSCGTSRHTGTSVEAVEE